MKDLQFQSKLKEKIEDPDVEDEEIVKWVLDYAWNQWPHSFERWLKNKRQYGGFK